LGREAAALAARGAAGLAAACLAARGAAGLAAARLAARGSAGLAARAAAGLAVRGAVAFAARGVAGAAAGDSVRWAGADPGTRAGADSGTCAGRLSLRRWGRLRGSPPRTPGGRSSAIRPTSSRTRPRAAPRARDMQPGRDPKTAARLGQVRRAPRKNPRNFETRRAVLCIERNTAPPGSGSSARGHAPRPLTSQSIVPILVRMFE
jgi:hypothetical protein